MTSYAGLVILLNDIEEFLEQQTDTDCVSISKARAALEKDLKKNLRLLQSELQTEKLGASQKTH